MNADDVMNEIANRLKTRKSLDQTIVKSVIETLIASDDPVSAVDALDSQLYTIAMRRVEKK